MFAISLQTQILRYHLQCSITEKQISRERKRAFKFKFGQIYRIYDAECQGHFFCSEKTLQSALNVISSK